MITKTMPWIQALSKIEQTQSLNKLRIVHNKVNRGLGLLNKSIYKTLSENENKELRLIDEWMDK